MTSELIDFGNELIKFENIDINDGIIYFFFVINKEVLQENNSDISSYNRLILSEVGIREGPLELSFSVGDYTQFKVTIKINITREIKEESNKNKSRSSRSRKSSSSSRSEGRSKYSKSYK